MFLLDWAIRVSVPRRRTKRLRAFYDSIAREGGRPRGYAG